MSLSAGAEPASKREAREQRSHFRMRDAFVLQQSREWVPGGKNRTSKTSDRAGAGGPVARRAGRQPWRSFLLGKGPADVTDMVPA